MKTLARESERLGKNEGGILGERIRREGLEGKDWEKRVVDGERGVRERERERKKERERET